MEKNKVQEILAQALEEAWENEDFKKELIANPLEAIADLTGESLGLKEGVKMVVADQSEADTFYFNIPNKPILEDVELSEDQMEMVAGGGWGGAIAGWIVGNAIGGPGSGLVHSVNGHLGEEKAKAEKFGR